MPRLGGWAVGGLCGIRQVSSVVPALLDGTWGVRVDHLCTECSVHSIPVE